MITIPTTAAALLRELDATPDTPEPPPAEPASSWLDYSESTAEPVGPAPEPERTYTATEAAELARQAVDAAERARPRPVALPPPIGQHIVYLRRAEPWWLLPAAVGVVCAVLGSFVGAVACLVMAVAAWARDWLS